MIKSRNAVECNGDGGKNKRGGLLYIASNNDDDDDDDEKHKVGCFMDDSFHWKLSKPKAWIDSR